MEYNKKKMIKVVNPDVADKLVSSGFSYILEQINGLNVYCFMKDELGNILNEFSSNDFFVDNLVSF